MTRYSFIIRIRFYKKSFAYNSANPSNTAKWMHKGSKQRRDDQAQTIIAYLKEQYKNMSTDKWSIGIRPREQNAPYENRSSSWLVRQLLLSLLLITGHFSGPHVLLHFRTSQRLLVSIYPYLVPCKNMLTSI